MAGAMENGNSNGVSTEDTIALPGESAWWESEGPVPASHNNGVINRNWFPSDFLFGTGSAAYQVEGYARKGGRGISIWDDFALTQPWRIADGSNGNVAADMYHRYKEDIKMMKQMGFTSFRFSISWTRILPAGRVSGGVNREGIDYYNGVINTLLENGITPFVTIFHWDLPVCLENEYGGFLSKRIRKDLCEFANLCFWEFGDRVKHWAVLNEPNVFTMQGYVTGTTPPGRKLPTTSNAAAYTKGATLPTAAADKFPDPPIAQPFEAYTVARNLLLSHADVVHLYRTKFQEVQEGKIGIVLFCDWTVPYHKNLNADHVAAARARDFLFGWFLEPLIWGQYPKSMRDLVPPENLPDFTKVERDLLIGSLDFLGLNYYTAQYAKDDRNPVGEGFLADQRVQVTSYKGQTPIGKPSGSNWPFYYGIICPSPFYYGIICLSPFYYGIICPSLFYYGIILFSVPWGIYELLMDLNKYYPSLKELYITENGFSTATDFKKTAEMVCENDEDRIKYHQDHLANMLKAMKNLKYEVKGYFVWAWCDTYEWNSGYTVRFGLNYVDFADDLARYPKNSAAWFSKFLHSKVQPPPYFHPWWIPAKSLVSETSRAIDELGRGNN